MSSIQISTVIIIFIDCVPQETKNLKLHMKKRHELCLDEYYVKYVNPKNGRRSIHVSHSQPVPALANSAPKVSTSISFGDWKYACRYDCKIW
jgi:hypothetical protein